MEDVYFGLIMSLIAVLCFISSNYQNGNGYIGLRGASYIFFRNINKRNLAFKISNRVFGSLLFIASVVYAIISLIIYQNTYNEFSTTYRALFIISIVLIVIVSDISAFITIKKDT